jgi:alanine racemase
MVGAGSTIGYGRHTQLTEPRQIAVIPIGYADGFSRAFSNGKGEVLINGQRAPVIGNVCMDMCMVDITDIDARTGDEVVVFGSFPSVIDLAKAIGTIPYELLTNIGDRVKRVYYMD